MCNVQYAVNLLRDQSKTSVYGYFVQGRRERGGHQPDCAARSDTAHCQGVQAQVPTILYSFILSFFHLVFRIHDILVWIRIRMRIRGSMPVDPDSDPNPAIFFIDLQDAKKIIIFIKVFCLLLFEGSFTSFFKDEKSKRSHKTVRIVTILLNGRRMIEGSGSGSTALTNGSGSGSRPKNM
jgi:hypothetical protein